MAYQPMQNLWISAVISCLLLCRGITLTQATLMEQTCSRDQTAIIQSGATAWIGGMISLNDRGSTGFGCGGFSGSMQAYEAMRWALDLLNKKNQTIGLERDYYVPGIPLGMRVKNYCSADLSGIVELLPELAGDEGSCSESATNFTLGLIGASTAPASRVSSDLTAPYSIPVISYETTATDLTAPGRYPNFMRTVPPDGPLSDVIVSVLSKLRWHRVVIVYSDESSLNELHPRLVSAGICLTATIRVQNDADLSSAGATMERVIGAASSGSENLTAVVFFGREQYAKALMQAGNADLPASGNLQWLLMDFPVDATFEAGTVYHRGVISITTASRFIVEFENHWVKINEFSPSPENPWFQGWFEDRHSCSFNPTSASQKNCDTVYPGGSREEREAKKRAVYQQDQDVEAAILSVFTYARALRTAHADLCGTVSGSCPQLRALTREQFYNQYLKKVDFTFSATERVPSLASKNILPYNAPKHLSFTPEGDISDPSYFIYNYNDLLNSPFSFKRVGTYINGALSLNMDNVAVYNQMRDTRLQPVPVSACGLGSCSPCLGLPADLKYYYAPGDFVINGIFSLHNAGESPLSCGGAVSSSRFQYLQAMIYALRSINADPNILPGITLGGLGLDDCSSGTLGQAFLAQVQRGGLRITDPSTGTTLDPLTIEAYTAAHNSALTLPLAEAMNILKRPMVGYRAGSAELDDRSRFPYYLRAVPGVAEEIRAIILLLKRLGMMYVQVVSSAKSSHAVETFRDLGAKAGICIVAVHNIGASDASVDAALEGVALHPQTPPVVALLSTPEYRALLAGMTRAQASSASRFQPASFTFIATTRFGTDHTVAKGYEAAANGIFSLSLESSTLATFRQYLQGLNATSTEALKNPWFSEWASHCTKDAQGMSCTYITEGTDFEINSGVEGVINAVHAIARGLHATLAQLCGANARSVCTDFLNSPVKTANFLSNLRNVVFDIEDSDPRRQFKFNGNGLEIPFAINRYEKDPAANRGEFKLLAFANPWTSQFIVQGSADLAVRTPLPTCPSPCLECLYRFNHLNYWYTPGDVVIAGIFDIHYRGVGPYDCGPMKTQDGALYPEVFKFALDRVNSGRGSVKLNNVRLGGLAFDGCSNPIRSSAIINRVHTGMEIVDANNERFDAQELISWMAYDSDTTVDAAKLVRNLGVPIVTPGATTGRLDDKSEYPTFFRTIPSDTLIVRAMADFIVQMGWKYVITLNAPDSASRESLDLFKQILEQNSVCLTYRYEFETDGSMPVIYNSITDKEGSTQVVAVFAEPDRHIEEFLTVADADDNFNLVFVANRPWGQIAEGRPDVTARSVFFSPDEADVVSEFTEYLRSRSALSVRDNPWFQETYSQIFKCNLPGVFSQDNACAGSPSAIPTSNTWRQDVRTLATVNAVEALAQSVHEVLIETCGSDYSGMCDDFMLNTNLHTRLMQKLDLASFTDISSALFSFIEREVFRLSQPAGSMQGRQLRLSVYRNDGRPDNKGSYRFNSLSLTDRDQLLADYAGVQSGCPGDCVQCSVGSADLTDFSLIQGDIYLIGLFDVHKRGSSPFTCSSEVNRKHGLPLQEAFNYAIEYVNSRQGIFKNILSGIQLGGISLDTCQSPSRTASLVANIHSGLTELTKQSLTVAPRIIEAYIGPMETEASVRVADILTQLGVPQISYGATGVDLLDMDRYSYFLRSVPADDKQARAMVSYLKKFEYNNIQVVSSFDEIGEPGRAEFLKLAKANKICVKIEYTAGEMGNVESDAATIVNRLSQDTTAQVVVLWMKNPIPMLEAASAVDAVSRTFLFIVTDKWGADPTVLANPKLETLLTNRKLIILDVETADIPRYDEYLELKTPDNYVRNPWFKDYFEQVQNCYWDTPRGTLDKPCDKSATIPRADDYVQDPYVLYVINAVFSAAMGIHKAVTKLCTINGVTLSGACGRYLTNGARRQQVLAGLKEVNFVDDTHQPFFFTPDGQSDRGFHVYNITGDRNTGFQFENVGSYNDSHFLKLDITYAPTVTAKCDADRSDPAMPDCVCEFPPDIRSRYMLEEEGDRGLTLVYVGDIHAPHPSNPLQCGAINTGPDLQKLLAFFYTIQRINNNTDNSLPDSLKLNGLALDSCTNGYRLGQDVYNVLSGNPLCGTDDVRLLVPPASIAGFVVDKDHNSLPISAMLRQSKITTISPSAGVTTMEGEEFGQPYFFSTRGDNSEIAAAMLSTAHRAGWNYVSGIYTDNAMHRAANTAMMAQSREAGVCVGETIALKVNATLDEAKAVLERLSASLGGRAVAAFVSQEHFALLLRASQALGLTGRFVWLAPTYWARDMTNIRGLEAELAGSLLFEARTAVVNDFNRYVKTLSAGNQLNIPDDWFKDIYESIHQCNMLTREQLDQGRRYPRVCTDDEVIPDSHPLLSQDPAVLHVIMSVEAAAFGLTNIPGCQQGDTNSQVLAACLQLLGDNKAQAIRDGVAGVEFDVLPELLGDQSFQFSFDTAGKGRAGITITNFQASSGASNYVNLPVGTYIDDDLSLDLSQYAARNLYTRGSLPTSDCGAGAVCQCSLPKQRVWTYRRPVTMDPSQIQVGGRYTDPESGRIVSVNEIPGPKDRFEDTWAIIVLIVACVGAIISFGVFVYLLVMYPVRGGTSILGFMLSFGIVLLYLTAIAFVAHADSQICGLRRFVLGVVYALVYGSLLVKLVDCWRVRGKDESYPAKYSKLGRPWGLFLITTMLVLVQVMINAEWLILEEPDMVRIFYDDKYWPRCTPDNFYDEGLVLSLCYVMVLIGVSLGLAFLTFTTTKNHRESRWILGILILSVPIWVLWCTVATLGPVRTRDAAVAIGLIVNATVMLLLVPVRKLYLLHKYNVLLDEEEEDASDGASQRDFGSVYGRQYDNRANLHDSGSAQGEDPDYSGVIYN